MREIAGWTWRRVGEFYDVSHKAVMSWYNNNIKYYTENGDAIAVIRSKGRKSTLLTEEIESIRQILPYQLALDAYLNLYKICSEDKDFMAAARIKTILEDYYGVEF